MVIKFSDESKEDLVNIEQYLLKKWNDKVLENFFDRLDFVTDLICSRKVVFQKYEDTDYHKLLITKHNTLIYSLNNETLIIHRIIQNFQNPEKNYKDLTE